MQRYLASHNHRFSSTSCLDFSECGQAGNGTERYKDKKGDKLLLFEDMAVYIESGKAYKYKLL